ncbi:hypothetical protein B0H16DRAFT_1858776 [Mycena metata]|uniref:DUF6534 domain-containing protein n=1 Tax=Mycena metata TaxID=1033252 RepID=A0AAD7NUV4_9AGAR|nr:hypothetical protein B0H16DRAFT_1858776 [Mycena metata]
MPDRHFDMQRGAEAWDFEALWHRRNHNGQCGEGISSKHGEQIKLRSGERLTEQMSGKSEETAFRYSVQPNLDHFPLDNDKNVGPITRSISPRVLMGSPLDRTYGVALVTLFLSAMYATPPVEPDLSYTNHSLYGTGLIQAYLYFRWYAKDHLILKTIVVSLIILETLQIVFLFDGMYLNLIDNFGNFGALDVIFWTQYDSFSGPWFWLNMNPKDSAALRGRHNLLPYLSAFLVQMYFGYCVYGLNPQNKVVPGIIMFLGLASLGSAIAQTIRTHQLGLFSHLDVTKPVITTQSASTLACDIVITSSLIYALRGKRGAIESYGNSANLQLPADMRDRLLKRFNLLTQRYLKFLVKPNTFYFFLGLIPSGKLYMNSMLATLNTREYVRNKGHNPRGWHSFPLAVMGSDQREAEAVAFASSGVGISLRFDQNSSVCAIPV